MFFILKQVKYEWILLIITILQLAGWKWYSKKFKKYAGNIEISKTTRQYHAWINVLKITK